MLLLAKVGKFSLTLWHFPEFNRMGNAIICWRCGLFFVESALVSKTKRLRLKLWAMGLFVKFRVSLVNAWSESQTLLLKWQFFPCQSATGHWKRRHSRCRCESWKLSSIYSAVPWEFGPNNTFAGVSRKVWSKISCLTLKSQALIAEVAICLARVDLCFHWSVAFRWRFSKGFDLVCRGFHWSCKLQTLTSRIFPAEVNLCFRCCAIWYIVFFAPVVSPNPWSGASFSPKLISAFGDVGFLVKSFKRFQSNQLWCLLNSQSPFSLKLAIDIANLGVSAAVSQEVLIWSVVFLAKAAIPSHCSHDTPLVMLVYLDEMLKGVLFWSVLMFTDVTMEPAGADWWWGDDDEKVKDESDLGALNRLRICPQGNVCLLVLVLALGCLMLLPLTYLAGWMSQRPSRWQYLHCLAFVEPPSPSPSPATRWS